MQGRSAAAGITMCLALVASVTACHQVQDLGEGFDDVTRVEAGGDASVLPDGSAMETGGADGTSTGCDGCVPSRSCAGDAAVPGCGQVVIPHGSSFEIGDTNAIGVHPVQHAITLSGDVAMDAYEVTVARYRRFWDAGHPAPMDAIVYPGGHLVQWYQVLPSPAFTSDNTNCNFSTQPGTREAHPMNCVTKADALAFCVWDGGRLPTLAEWEWAARWRPIAGLPSPRRYPWGDTDPSSGCDRAQWNDCPGLGGAPTRPVGSFADSGGLFDLGGNVWEYVVDQFSDFSDPNCWGDVPRTDPLCDTTDASTSDWARGGAFDSGDARLLWGASGVQVPLDGAARNASFGFRCAQSL